MSKILVVDDDPQSRQLYVALLTPFGHEVLEAQDGSEGLERALRTKPDLVISDILMPTMNGYEFVSALRACPDVAGTPIIFSSATFLDRATRSMGASCGVSLFITKPFDPEKVVEIVQDSLGLKLENALRPHPPQPGSDAIPLLIDAYFEKGEQFNAVSARLAALLDLGMSLARTHSTEELMERAGTAARKIIGARFCGIGILSGSGFQLRCFKFFGADPEVSAQLERREFCGPLFRDIVQERKAQLTFSPFGEPERLDLPACHPPIHSFLGVPLEVGNQVYGWLYVADKLASLEFDTEDCRILTSLAAQVALAHENAQRFHMVEEHSRKLELEIDERKRSDERFRMVIETSPMGIIISDAQGRIAEVNVQALRLFGYGREELMGQNIEMLLPERLQKSHKEHRANYARNPAVRPMGVGLELYAQRKDGTEFPVEISLGPLATKESALVSATIVDITARKKMEQQFRLAQRMEAIGQLAGGVAHDFNNLLGVILGCTELVSEELPSGHPAIRKLGMIRQASESAASLTHQLLAFSRQQMLQPHVLEPNQILEKTEALLRRLIGENIQLSLSIEPSLGRIKADPTQIEQVLVNLAVNARDAMPKGGRLIIGAANVELDQSYVEEHQPVVSGRYVMLSVADTGSGMDQKTQARIFEPFFTTKELGKGTGLGLSTVYGIVKQSGGYVWVYSEVGQGTIFKIYLPRVDEVIQNAAIEAPEKSNEKACETILVVEDSESLLEMASEYLETIGYMVVSASSGNEALQKCKEFEGPIHLLLTDVVMPGMSGPDLAVQVKSLRPGIEVIFTSGYTDDAIARQGILDPAAAFIEKPYRPNALGRKVHEVLSRKISHQENIVPT